MSSRFSLRRVIPRNFSAYTRIFILSALLVGVSGVMPVNDTYAANPKILTRLWEAITGAANPPKRASRNVQGLEDVLGGNTSKGGSSQTPDPIEGNNGMSIGDRLTFHGGMTGARVARTINSNNYSQENLTELHNADSISCVFTSSAVGEWTANSINVTTEQDQLVLIFNEIGLEDNTAVITGNAGSGRVFVQKTAGGIVFIEPVLAGAINLTFVSAIYREGSEHFLATTSRNTTIPDLQLYTPSQFYGTCTTLS